MNRHDNTDVHPLRNGGEDSQASRRLLPGRWLRGEGAARSPLRLENSFPEGTTGPVQSPFTVAVRA